MAGLWLRGCGPNGPNGSASPPRRREGLRGAPPPPAFVRRRLRGGDGGGPGEVRSGGARGPGRAL